MSIRSNSPLRISLKFEEVLTAIVAVVGSSRTRSTPAQVSVRYLDRPATPTTPAIVRVRIAIAAKCTVAELLALLRAVYSGNASSGGID